MGAIVCTLTISPLPLQIVLPTPPPVSMATAKPRPLPLLSVLMVLVVAVPLTQQQVLPPIIIEENFRCENLTVITMCTEVYPLASFPNYRDHQTQEAANNELLNFTPLIRGVCSEAIVHFLCSIYAPFCQVDRSNIRVRPCKELCEFVREGCEDDLRLFGLDWPPHLDCANFQPDSATDLDFCPDNVTAVRIPSNVPTDSPMTDSGVGVSTVITPSTPPPPVVVACPIHLTVTPNLENKSYTFGGVSNCGMNCTGVFFSNLERNIIAPVFILLFAVICVLFTLFAVATFLIDRHRFHYPERPIIFISFCYLIVAILYMVGAISKLAGGDGQAFSCSDENAGTSFVLQRLPNSESTYKNASCVILFVVVYFFHMASAIWWIILTMTWFLAAALKWGEEAVEKLWLLYHIIAWGIPAIQVILVLALRLVDGDQLSGLCSTGNLNSVGLGVFMFLPLTFYLLVGVVFLVIGFTALVNIRLQLQQDAAKAHKIGRLIMRVALYSGLYIGFNVVFLILLLYELARKSIWESSYIDDCGMISASEECAGGSPPSFAAFVIKYIMIFAVGICSTTWIFSTKTFAAWQKLFCRCNDTKGNQYDVPAAMPIQHQYDTPMMKPQYDNMPPQKMQYGIPNPKQQYVLPEKHGDLSSLQYPPQPHTSV